MSNISWRYLIEKFGKSFPNMWFNTLEWLLVAAALRYLGQVTGQSWIDVVAWISGYLIVFYVVSSIAYATGDIHEIIYYRVKGRMRVLYCVFLAAVFGPMLVGGAFAMSYLFDIIDTLAILQE